MIVLDIVTPLLHVPIDVRGNAQHWAIRTMGAALEKTRDHWLAMFDSSQAWEEFYVGPAVLGWQDYMSETFTTRHGRKKRTSQRRGQRRMQESFLDARANWQDAFRDNAEHFYQTMLRKSQNYNDATQFFLDLVGLKLADYVGPFAFHLRALFGNRRLLEHLGPVVEIRHLEFPAPPIIPRNLRPLFFHDMMSVLGREVYLMLVDHEQDPPNDRLDAILGGYLAFEYAGPPTSYCRVEFLAGGWSLHTHIEGTPTAEPPIAHDLRSAVPRIEPPTGSAMIVEDLFAFGEARTYPIARMQMEVEFEFHPDFYAHCYIQSSDNLSDLVDFHLFPNQPVELPLLPAGETWELHLYVEGVADNPFGVVMIGRLWFLDDHGNESNHAYWSIAGRKLAAYPFDVLRPFALPAPFTIVPVPDWFAHASYGDYPFAALHVQVEFLTTTGQFVALLLHRSDDPGEGIEISNQLSTDVMVPFPSPDVTWQLVVVAGLNFPLGQTIIAAGTFWVEDTSGAISNKARWSVTLAFVP
jgi:hypothetical protein